MRSLGVVKQNPVSNHLAGMLDGLESVAVYALLFEGSNHALHNAILNRTFAHLPIHQLKHALHRVFVHAEQIGNCAIAKGGVLFNHGLDGVDIHLADLGCGFGGLVIDRPAWHFESSAKLLDAHFQTVFKESPLNLENHLSSSSPRRD